MTFWLPRKLNADALEALPWIGCRLERIEFDYATRAAAMWLPARHVPDMRRCVAHAVALWPEIQRIEVFSGGLPEINYALRDGRWTAHPQRRRRERNASARCPVEA